MRNFRRRFASAACLGALLLCGACSGDGSSSAGSSGSEEPETFSVDEVDLSFELPSDWDDFDLDKMQEALSDNTVMDDLNDRLGMSREQFEQMMANNIVLFVTAPKAVDGFLDNVNVLVAEGRLPTQGALELQYRGLGATDISSEEASTDAGDGYTTSYTLELEEGTEVHGQAIALDLEDRIAVITISRHDADKAAELGEQVLSSLASTQ